MNGLLAACLGITRVSLAVAGAASQLSFLQVRDPGDGIFSPSGPLPLHLLDLTHDVQSPYFDWDLCNTKVFSNLGGLGPDSGPNELRFGQIGDYQGTPVDLVVVNTSTYLVNDVYRNTARGCFGVVNVAKDSFVDLSFTFVESGTNTPVKSRDPVYFSMFDLDCSATGCERLTMKTDAKFYVDTDTELTVLDSGGLSFEATTFGVGSDNPPPLEALQQSRAVTFELSQMSFAMTYTVQNSRIGRNFLIGGKTMLPPPKPSATTTTLPGKEQCHECVVWGDPHVITFDVSKKRLAQHPLREAFFRTRGWKSDQLSIYQEGTFWLVKSRRVRIQARYWHNKTHPDWTNLGALAIGGPFLKHNTLIIRPLASSTTWNGHEILPTMPSQFHNELVQANFHRDSEIVENGKTGAGIDIQLPAGVRLTVNRWKQSLAVRIGMCPQAGGQHGQCGNYNGKSSDDDVDLLSSAQRVPEKEFLF